MELIKSTIEEKKKLDEVRSFLDGPALNSNQDREFLTSLVLRHKPKKLLEVGVFAGGSSIVLLNAIKEDSDARLYSIDYTESWTTYTGYTGDPTVHKKSVQWLRRRFPT